MSYVENPRITFHRNLRRILDEYRRRYGYGYRRVAELAGVGERDMLLYKGGKSYPEPETIAKIARALGVRVEDFYRLDL